MQSIIYVCFLKQFYTVINLLLLKMKADSDAWMVLTEQSWGAKLMTCSFKCMLQVNLLLQFFCIQVCLYVEYKEENQMRINHYILCYSYFRKQL